MTGSFMAARRLKQRVFRTVVLVAAGLFFLVPIAAMIEFTTRGKHPGERNLDAWRLIFTFPDLVTALVASLQLAVITSLAMLLLLVPTMIWVRLRLPRLNRVVEFISLLPLTIPAIVLVVGLYPMYLWLGTNLSDNILTLAFAYIVLVLPYSYRALDAGLSAIDLKTLSEAARSLGAAWPDVILRVIVPNISNAILSACLLSVALVLGEYTIALNLLYNNLQVEIAQLGRIDAGVSIAVAVASLLFAFALLIAISFVGSRRRRNVPEPLTTFGRGPVQGSAG
jgi:putative spermidine/putrescine transport system permease protein